MPRTRRNFTAEFKAQVVLETMSGGHSINRQQIGGSQPNNHLVPSVYGVR